MANTDMARVASTNAVAASSALFTLLSANKTRKSATVFNDSDKILYLGYNSDVSSSKYKVNLQPGASWDMPSPYSGAIYGICEAAVTGNIMCTEES